MKRFLISKIILNFEISLLAFFIKIVQYSKDYMKMFSHPKKSLFLFTNKFFWEKFLRKKYNKCEVIIQKTQTLSVRNQMAEKCTENPFLVSEEI